MKTRTNISIDPKLLKLAKEKKINVSQITEDSIKNAVGKTEVTMLQPTHCEFCNREMKKATRDDLNGLTWLYPDERWICPSCLRNLNRGL